MNYDYYLETPYYDNFDEYEVMTYDPLLEEVYSALSEVHNAELYMPMTSAENKTSIFKHAFRDFGYKFDNWIKRNKFESLKGIKDVKEIIDKAQAVLSEHYWELNEPGNHDGIFRQVRKILYTAAPFLVDLDKQGHELYESRMNDYELVSTQLLKVKKKMNGYASKEATRWQNIKQISKLYKFAQRLPEKARDCYSNELERAEFLYECLQQTPYMECPRTTLGIFHDIDKTFSKHLDTHKELSDNVKAVLVQINDFLDKDLSTEEYCKRYGLHLFDSIERNDSWENLYLYESYFETSCHWMDKPKYYGKNYIRVRMLYIKEYLRKIRRVKWKDWIELAWESDERHCTMVIGGHKVNTDDLNLYLFYRKLEAIEYGYHEKEEEIDEWEYYYKLFDYMEGFLESWRNVMYVHRLITPEDYARVNEILGTINNAMDFVKNNKKDFDIPKKMVYDCIPVIDDIEYFIRYGRQQKKE